MRSLCAAVGLLGLLAGPAVATDEWDPIEPFNRGIFWFNDTLDTWVLAPVAKGIDFVLPDLVQASISNFFYNIRFPIYLANDVLQGKPAAAGKDVVRFGVNSTFGIGGLFDAAEAIGLPAKVEDFGQTLGHWGVPPGPYLVLPFLGPSNLRDGAGLVADSAASVGPFFVESLYLVAGQVGFFVNERSRYIDEVDAAKEASLDYYLFVRNAYLQRREALIDDRLQGSTTSQFDLYQDPETEKDLYFPDEE